MHKQEKFYREVSLCFLKYKLEIEHPSEQQIEEMKIFLFASYLNMGSKGTAKLTPQEKRCLYYSSQGYTYKNIAVILKISPQTVRSYHKTLLSKLNCSTMRQAIMRAYCLAILPVPIPQIFT